MSENNTLGGDSEPVAKRDGTADLTPERVEAARKLKSEGKEMEASEDAKSVSPFEGSDIPGVGLMYTLGTLTPFHSLFLFFANGRFGSTKQHLRVSNMIKAHPVLYMLCRRSDYVFRVLVTATLFLFVAIVLAAGVYKLFLADIIPQLITQWRALRT